jgi:protein-disulfide isomerase
MKMHLRPLLAPLLLASIACGGGAAVAPTAAPVVVPSPSPVAAVAVAAPELPTETDAAVPIAPHNPTWGSRTALVTVVEFSDFQCPYCAKAEPTLSALREAYGPDKLRIVWKNLPLSFHPNARPAAEAAAGVFEMGGNRAFWAFHDLAFAGQRDLGTDSYEAWARQAGVADAGAIRAGLSSKKWADVVSADERDAQLVGAEGTPSFFVNGVFVVGAQPLEKFKGVVDQELAKAQAKLDAGTPRGRLYAAMAHENRMHAPPPEEEDEERPTDAGTVFKVPLGTSPVRGAPASLVTLVEFADFQCPFSGRVEATLDAIRAKYGDKVRIVWKNQPLPFHKMAEPAAEAAAEVRAEKGDAAFWKMHDKLFAAQKDLSEAVIVKLAVESGASAGRVQAAMTTRKYAHAIESDQGEADDFGAGGTPTFFVNGRKLVGAQPEATFDRLIDEEAAKAEGLVAKGTPLASLYAALTANGQGPPEPERKALAALPGLEPTRGPATARVTVHEWADFQCPFCERVEDTLKHLSKDYGTRVKIVWHDLPLSFHQDAGLAAQAGREAFAQKGSTGFWALHDVLFADQKKLKRDDLDLAARALGLDMRRWAAALDNGLHQREIDDEKKAAEAMSITGTPAFVVVPAGAGDGYFISGAQPYTRFRKVVDRALGEAR